MTEILHNEADKDVLESIIRSRVQHFPAWREKSEPVEMCPERFILAVVEKNPVFSDRIRGC